MNAKSRKLVSRTVIFSIPIAKKRSMTLSCSEKAPGKPKASSDPTFFNPPIPAAYVANHKSSAKCIQRVVMRDVFGIPLPSSDFSFPNSAP
jgi:hypothetical protein